MQLFTQESGTQLASGTPVGSQTKQADGLVTRVCELGRANISVVEIDRILYRERFRTSSGTPWPPKNDGRVIVRLLLNSGINPVPGDTRIKKYALEYAAKLREKSNRLSQSQSQR